MTNLLPELHIQSSLADYRVLFSSHKDLKEWASRADLLLVDTFFKDRLDLPADIPVIWIEATENAKALQETLHLFVALKQAGLGRSSRIAAIGGGVVQDIATFVASLFMRGISWSYAPTTVLGMADSCLGGKSSINVGSYKNLVGNFFPPCQIDIFPVFARTLPLAEMAGGLAEAAKIAFCRGNSVFETYQRLAMPVLNGSWQEQQLAELLHATLSVKQWFIETDEFDQAERRLLNFGHTWGHALESATNFAIPHGLAVAVGMMASICYTQHQTTSLGLYQHCLDLLLPVVKPSQLQVFDKDLFLKAFYADKKHTPGKLHLIVPAVSVPSGLGVKEIQRPDDQDGIDAVLGAMLEALTMLDKELSSSQSGKTSES